MSFPTQFFNLKKYIRSDIFEDEAETLADTGSSKDSSADAFSSASEKPTKLQKQFD